MLGLAPWASLSFLVSLPFSFADHEGFYQNEDYNAGKFGWYVRQGFKTTTVTAPVLNVNTPFTECDDGSLLFIAPRGEKAEPRPYILDPSGALIWTPKERFGQVYNIQVQHYKGEPYVCFWGGDDSIGGHGEGQIYMYDQHYDLKKTVKGANGFALDLHSFAITRNDTAVFTGYDIIEKELKFGRTVRTGYIWDSLFQELDLETNEIVFQWRASDHMKIDDTYAVRGAAVRQSPWDWFHINCVEKDDLGNYLVSSRYLRSIIYVSGKTGEVLWQLGGKSNSFQDLSGGAATATIGQHDAHWADDPVYHGAITFFDNRADWTVHNEPNSRGSRVRVDVERMTATLAATYVHTGDSVLSVSQGSYQTLPNGHVVVGFGFNGVMTEFAPDGTVLCDAYFEPSKHFTSGNVQSYRNMKFNWTGTPNTKPSLILSEGVLYMSWMGSTEVKRWLLQSAVSEDDIFEEVLTIPKKGFESRHGLSQNIRIKQYVQVVALDETGRALAISDRVDIEDYATVFANDENLLDYDDEQEAEDEDFKSDIEDLQLLVGLGTIAVLTGFLLCCVIFGQRMFKPLARVQDELLSKESWDVAPVTSGPMKMWRMFREKVLRKKRWHEVPQEEAPEASDEDVRLPSALPGGLSNHYR
ncbi:hypothetical protein EJ03DRAFT_330895 [Teratosphaeria nubilosa]|uniref:ASST-domain-containing protein n=1 Tax=Teratosphaeria nubilosa TaxID=161662 RepID=A0A6G1KZB5_9PEZI|nr:hypothetical protein EJ03DRAFT_330895 [Teratosphaeria nubilosa]